VDFARREKSTFITNNHPSILVCIKWLELLRALQNDARDVVNAKSKEYVSILANAAHAKPDTLSSNATKPVQHVQIVYNADGNALAMARTYAGLPNMSALVHHRLRQELIKVANRPCNKYHSSHYTKIGALQTRKVSAYL
jgi:hypothetical protein